MIILILSWFDRYIKSYFLFLGNDIEELYSNPEKLGSLIESILSIEDWLNVVSKFFDAYYGPVSSKLDLDSFCMIFFLLTFREKSFFCSSILKKKSSYCDITIDGVGIVQKL